MIRRISLRGHHFNVHVAGQGKPILFLHGFPLDHTMWSGQLEEFARTHQVIAPDLRGFGGSDVSAGTLTMEQLADDAIGLLDALDVQEPVTVCGLSMGGYVAWQIGMRMPSRVERLIQCDTRAAADSDEAKQVRELNAQRALQEGTGFLVESMIGRLFSPTFAGSRPEIVAEVKQVMARTPVQTVVGALRGMAIRDDVTPLLPKIDVPVLLIVGSEDGISPPREMREIGQSIPRSTFAEIAGAGHMAPLETPGMVNRVIREFLPG